MISNWLRKEGCTKDVGVAKKMGSGVGPEGGVGNFLIRSAVGSSDLVCIVSIRADGAGVIMSNASISSSSNSLTTLHTMVLTDTSLGGGEVSAVRVLSEWVGSSLAWASSSRLGSEASG